MFPLVARLAVLLPACAPEPAPFPYLPDTPLAVPCDPGEDGVVDVADPQVIRWNGRWYLYATCSQVDLEVWSSDDLLTWTPGGTLWAPPAGAWSDGGVWAPHVSAWNDAWYLHYTAGLRIGVARADTPTGPFVDVYDHPLVGGGHGGVGDGVDDGMVDPAEWAIDPSLFQEADGTLWLYHTRYTPFSTVVAVPMDDPVTVREDQAVEVLAPDEDWEGAIVEAPWLLAHAADRFLLYSGNRAETADYTVGVARGARPTGPFTRLEPLLATDPDTARWGPGHVSVAPGRGDDLLLFYHAKIEEEEGFERRLRYAVLSFGPDGTPRVDLP